MLRFIAPSLCLLLAMPLATQAASKQEYELTRMLEKVAKQSSVGTPRAINEDILDQGYTVEGKQLINHLSVRASHAQKMQANPNDPEGWRMLGWSYFQTARYADAAKAYAKAIALKPDGEGYQSAYGEALVQEAGGQITPAAAAAFHSSCCCPCCRSEETRSSS